MFEGRIVNRGDHYKWGIKTGAGTMRGREKSIALVRDHTFNWNNYSDFGKKGGSFRYLMVRVERETILTENVRSVTSLPVIGTGSD
jgi:cAMP phosphodiesterase